MRARKCAAILDVSDSPSLCTYEGATVPGPRLSGRELHSPSTKLFYLFESEVWNASIDQSEKPGPRALALVMLSSTAFA